MVPLGWYELGAALLTEIGKYVRDHILGRKITVRPDGPIVIDIGPHAEEAIKMLAQAWSTHDANLPTDSSGQQLMTLGSQVVKLAPKKIRELARRDDISDEWLGRLAVFGGPPELKILVNQTLAVLVDYLDSIKSQDRSVSAENLFEFVEQRIVDADISNYDETKEILRQFLERSRKPQNI